MGKGVLLRFLASVTIFFTFAKVALPQGQTHPGQLPAELQVPDIKISSTAGYIVETHQPTTPQQHPPIIVHIQEAHTNYEAQQHIISILEQLTKEYGLKLILVEGGEGDVSLSYLRHYGSVDHRKQVAEKYLKAGLISGEEYLDVVSDYPLILWGVEERSLYDKHVEIFLGSQPLRKSLQPVLDAVRNAAESLRPHVLDPDVNALDQQAKAFEQQEVSLADYAGVLEALATRHGVAITGYPNLERFLEVRRLEHTIQRNQTQLEQRALIAKLSTQLPPHEVDALLARAADMKDGTISLVEFYTVLEHLAHVAHIDLNAYPNFSQYLHYVTQSAQVAATVLADELDQFAAALRRKLSTTPESQQLNTVLETVGLLDKLLNFNLSPEEYQRVTNLDVRNRWSDWESFLNSQLDRAGLPRQSFQGLRELASQLPTLHRFYEVAAQRDEVLVDHAITKLQASGERLAVLITGGFHSPRMTAMLKDRGVATIVLIPKVSRPTDERLYQAVVRYKSGHGGSVEEVMDLANQGAATTEGPR